jgi:hypothetical protein
MLLADFTRRGEVDVNKPQSTGGDMIAKAQKFRLAVAGLCLTGLVWGGTGAATASEQPVTEQERLERLEQENQELRRRLEALEQKTLQDISLPSAEIPSKTLEFLGQTEIGGGIMATWFTDLSKPGSAGTMIPGLGIGTYNHNAFSINLAQIYLENPSEASGERWDGGFKVSVLLGQDVDGLGDGLDFGGGAGAVWEAYASMNIPVWNGIVVKAGKFATYHGNEVVEPWLNRHITYGNQFPFVEPFTHTGIAAETALTDQLSLMLSVNNGWDQTFELGDGPSFMGHLAFDPSDRTSLSLIGHVGSETGEASEMRSSVGLLASQQITDQIRATLQADYGCQEFDSGSTASWYAVGGWLEWDFTERWGLGLRGDWVKGTQGLPGTGFSDGISESDLTLISGTATLRFRPPVEGLETRLEVRYDNTNDEAFFGGVNDRVILAIAAMYSF